jgi:signal transduction histidine kinase
VFLSQPLLAEAKCSEEHVMKAVEEAVAVLQQKGEAGLTKVGEIRFCDDNYVFVNDFAGKTLMHIKPQLIGKVLIELKDDKGKRFFADFTAMAQSSKGSVKGKSYYNGTGWVTYRWPKPGEKAFSPKLTYVKGCLMANQNVYVGAGIYQ